MGKGLLLIALATSIFLVVIPVALFFEMYRRKQRYGSFLPSREESMATRTSRKGPPALWKRVALAAMYTVCASFFTMDTLSRAHGRAFLWIGVAFWWTAAILSSVSVFQPSDNQFARVLHSLFGRVGYIQIASPGLERRILSRYRTEMDELATLGFSLLFWEGETFPVLSLLLVFPALVLLVMWQKKEVISVYGGTRILVGQPILGSADKVAYANPGAMGTKFRTRFRNGRVLESRNFSEAEEEFNGPTLIRRIYPKASISETWAEHLRTLGIMEENGDQIDRELNFDAWEEVVRSVSLVTLGGPPKSAGSAAVP